MTDNSATDVGAIVVNVRNKTIAVHEVHTGCMADATLDGFPGCRPDQNNDVRAISNPIDSGTSVLGQPLVNVRW